MWAHDYKIKVIKDPHYLGERVLGLFSPDRQEIILSKQLEKMPSREAEILLHEVMHGVAHNAKTFGMLPNNLKDEVEEHVIQSMTNGLILVLQQNKDFYSWLGERIYG